MTIAQLRYFCEVSKRGNITKAAEALHISQPSVSAAIRSLEEELSVDLFHRIRMRLSLTHEGEFFYRRAEGILADLDSLTAEMRAFCHKDNKVRIGVPAMIGTYLFPQVFESFHAAYPGIDVETVEQGSLRIREMIENESLDAAFAVDCGDNKMAASYPLIKSELWFCVDRRHPLSGRTCIDLSDLKGEPVIMLQDGSYQNGLLLSRFERLGIAPKVLMYTSQLYTIKRMLAGLQAGVFLFRQIAEMDDDFIGIPLADPVETGVTLIWKKDRRLSPPAVKLIDLVKRYFDLKKV